MSGVIGVSWAAVGSAQAGYWLHLTGEHTEAGRLAGKGCQRLSRSFKVDVCDSWTDRETRAYKAVPRGQQGPSSVQDLVLSILRGASWPKMATKAPEKGRPHSRLKGRPRGGEGISAQGRRRNLSQGLTLIAWPIPQQQENLGNSLLETRTACQESMGPGQPASARRRRVQVSWGWPVRLWRAWSFLWPRASKTSGGERNSWRQVSGWQCGRRELPDRSS